MIKPLRLFFLRRFPPRIETAEHFFRYVIHVLVHIIQVSEQERFLKIVIGGIIFRESGSDHIPEHQRNLMVCQSDLVEISACFAVKCPLFRF